jgi:hypothetical protein
MKRIARSPLAWVLVVVPILLPAASQACSVTMGGVAYPSIQAAVNVAPMIATINVDGSTGVCSENVLIPNVTLRMILLGANNATIAGVAGSPAVDARVKGFMIRGFTVTGGNRGIHLQRNTNAIIDAVTVQNTGGEGILIDSMALGVVTNSTIRNNPGSGIKVAELAHARIGANLPEDPGPLGALAPNTIQSNAGDGVLVTNKSTAQIIGNTISGNTGNGINVTASSSASTAGNLVNANHLAGVAASGRSYVGLGMFTTFADPDTTTVKNGQFGVSCASGAVISGNIAGANALAGATSQFGPKVNAFDPTCPEPASKLAVIQMVTGTLAVQREVAQTGLAIAMASIVLQSQLQILFNLVGFGSAGCQPLTGGGSVQLGSTPNTVNVYFDSACSKLYIAASANVTRTNQGNDVLMTVAETATYYSPSEAVIGSMTLNESAFLSTTGTYQVYGLGLFTPAGGARTPVQLGLACTIPTPPTGATSMSFPCSGGIAQNFPSLGLAMGGVTTLNLTLPLNSSGAVSGALTFSGGGTTVSGAPGSLTLTNPTPSSLVINGGTAFGVDTASGGAASFALFPPTPTGWSLGDAVHDQTFQISVVDNVARTLAAAIVQNSTGKTLATATLDQSGTGSITYSDGSTAAIANWTLAD